jgi:hypothetical protein
VAVLLVMPQLFALVVAETVAEPRLAVLEGGAREPAEDDDARCGDSARPRPGRALAFGREGS